MFLDPEQRGAWVLCLEQIVFTRHSGEETLWFCILCPRCRQTEANILANISILQATLAQVFKTSESTVVAIAIK